MDPCWLTDFLHGHHFYNLKQDIEKFINSFDTKEQFIEKMHQKHNFNKQEIKKLLDIKPNKKIITLILLIKTYVFNELIF